MLSVVCVYTCIRTTEVRFTSILAGTCWIVGGVGRSTECLGERYRVTLALAPLNVTVSVCLSVTGIISLRAAFSELILVSGLGHGVTRGNHDRVHEKAHILHDTCLEEDSRWALVSCLGHSNTPSFFVYEVADGVTVLGLKGGRLFAVDAFVGEARQQVSEFVGAPLPKEV